ncbi:hypothetical protein BAE44_0013628 [Dichanthelium oligosanthes]|uniref:F-box domain-containing protein n=1 Tax=Dichanthelium oligosanthes TaxID=888268 RepID=A0A1E5VJS9_9POAL|nr:hypothetical protein BAE44_0013628 [Dichanthelium oligosanthes]
MDAHEPSLPDDVLLEILVRLPACSIGRFRAATTHPSFDRTLAQRPPAVAKVTSELAFNVAGPPRPAVAFTRPNERGLPACRVHGSWDGVLCLQPYSQFALLPHHKPTGAVDYVLWNPVTEALATVHGLTGGGRVIGGYAHPVTRRFHLLHSSDDAVPDGKLIFMKSDRDRPISVHGDLHWLVQQSETRKVTLLVFDTVHKRFWLMAARRGVAGTGRR